MDTARRQRRTGLVAEASPRATGAGLLTTGGTVWRFGSRDRDSVQYWTDTGGPRHV